MVTLYVESNFIVGYALGRDLQDEVLLSLSRQADIRLLVPNVCLFEALSWLQGEMRRWDQFGQELAQRIRELGRYPAFPHAVPMRSHLQDAFVVNGRVSQLINVRLTTVARELAEHANFLQLGPEALSRSIDEELIRDRTDNLILHCILHHALGDPAGPKAFLSGNSSDFNQERPREALRRAGVRYFTKAGDFFGWRGSQGGAEGGDPSGS